MSSEFDTICIVDDCDKPRVSGSDLCAYHKKHLPENQADEIADAVIKRLAAEGYDAFRPGGYHDVSEFVRKAIVGEITKVAPPCPNCQMLCCRCTGEEDLRY